MLTTRELKELRALRQRKNRAASRRFLAEGIRVVEDLLASPLQLHWVVTASSLEDTERGRRLLLDLDSMGAPHRQVSDADFGRIADTESPQGIIAVAGVPDTRLEDLDQLVAARDRSVVLLLDAVQDPGNLGTMIRSAEAFGATAVVLLPGTVDPWNTKAVRSAAGSSFRVPLLTASWDDARAALERLGFEILGAAADGPPLHEPPARAAVVLGNEGSGLSPAVATSVHRLVGIPTPGRAESLNVTAAAAILLYELSRGTAGRE